MKNNCQHGVLVHDCYYCSGGNLARLLVSHDPLEDAKADAAMWRMKAETLEAEIARLRAEPPTDPNDFSREIGTGMERVENSPQHPHERDGRDLRPVLYPDGGCHICGLDILRDEFKARIDEIQKRLAEPPTDGDREAIQRGIDQAAKGDVVKYPPGYFSDLVDGDLISRKAALDILYNTHEFYQSETAISTVPVQHAISLIESLAAEPPSAPAPASELEGLRLAEQLVYQRMMAVGKENPDGLISILPDSLATAWQLLRDEIEQRLGVPESEEA